MNHEAQLAKTLGDDEQEKLASHFASYTVDELASLLKEKTALAPMPAPAATQGDLMRERTKGGRMINTLKNTFKPPVLASVKIADEWGRQLANEDIEKNAFMDQALGLAVGHHYGKEQKKRGENYSFGVPQGAAALFLPGGAGYQIGRYIGHNDKSVKKGKKKKASAQLVYEALMEKISTGAVGNLGGQMPSLTPKMPTAPKVGAGNMMPRIGTVGGGGLGKTVTGAARLRAEMDKVAFWGSGTIAKGINWAAPHLAKATSALASAGPGKSALIGAGVGAAGGAARHALSGRDPQTGQKRTTLLGSMAGGAALGGAAGAGLSAGASRFQGSALHGRMTSGNFKFNTQPPAAAAGAAGAAGPTPVAQPAPVGPGGLRPNPEGAPAHWRNAPPPPAAGPQAAGPQPTPVKKGWFGLGR